MILNLNRGGARDAKAFIEKVYRTVQRRDLEALVELFAEDCEFIDVTQPDSAQGRDALRAYMEETFTGMPDFRPQSWNLISDGDDVAAELELAGTHEGELFGYEGTGQKVRWSAAAFYTLNESHDQILREVYYYDLSTLTAQLKGKAAGAGEGV